MGPPCLENPAEKLLQVLGIPQIWKAQKTKNEQTSTWYPSQQLFNWLFQLDGSNSLLGQWLFHKQSLSSGCFRVPGYTGSQIETPGYFLVP